MPPGEIRAQLDRILASATFADAERARKFLRFVVENALAGRAAEIKESVIAVEALGRPPLFDPRSDPIVRVEAGRLRTKLLSYYHSEGSNDAVLIDLPKGGYVPRFQERPSPVPSRDKKRGLNSKGPVRLWLRAALAVGVALCGAAWLCFGRQVSAPRETLRVSILPPEGASLQTSAISPDGNYLVFTARSGRMTRLWLRALNASDPKPLSDTEGAAYPFWSPDSQSVGFFTAEILKSIRITGGPSHAISRVHSAFGGSWGNRGSIIFAQRPTGAIFEVASEGGTPRPVTVPDRSLGEIAHVFPQFLPDGLHFVYSVIRRAPAESIARAASIHSPAFKDILNAEPGVMYAPPHAGSPGVLLFAYHNAIMSQPFDPAKLALTGTALQVAPAVRNTELRPDFSVSSTGILAYQAGTGNYRQLTWFDRHGNRLGTVGSRNDYRSIQLSPDESRVAIQAIDRSSGRSEIWVLDLNRGALSRAGAGALEAFAPIWSPDGKEILFSASTERGMILARQQIDQVHSTPFLTTRGIEVATDWSTDSRLVTYSKFQSDAGVWTKTVNDGPEEEGRCYSPGPGECCAAFSPASPQGPEFIAYVSGETGRQEVYVRTMLNGEHKWQVSNAGGWLPHWSRDGRELFYVALDGRLMAVAVSRAHGSGFTEGNPEPLFDTSISPFAYPHLPGNFYAISRNGRFLVNSRVENLLPESITVIIPYR
jgi:eukaryotic-like serine/threonine-protein kinase